MPLATAVFALFAGGIAAWFVVARIMTLPSSFLPEVAVATVVAALVLASAQAFTLVTPDFGLPRVLVSLFLLVLLLNTLAAAPDRPRVLRSLLVIVGSTFTLKFVVLAALSDPACGRLTRVLQVLFEGLTLGALSQERFHPATSYLAFATLVLYLLGLALLPGGRLSGALARPGTGLDVRGEP